MRACESWSRRPYRPPFYEVGMPYLSRVAPEAGRIAIEWLPEGTGEYEVFFREKGEGAFRSAGRTEGTEFVLTDLTDGRDYEFYVASGHGRSRIRLGKSGRAVGTVVNYLHPEDDAYAFSGKALCSPSLVRLPDGALLASMDVFRGDWPQDLTLVFRSEDDGKTWHYSCEVYPCFWGKLFVHRGSLYLLGCSTEYGDLLIGRSDDGGRSFSAPSVLLRGGGGKNGEPGVHKNPQPVVSFRGRLWNTLEWGSWARGYHAAMVMSVPEDADLLDPAEWRFSEPVKYDPGWPGVPAGESTGNIEGCLVEKDGALYNVMRYDMERLERKFGLAVVYRVDTEDPEGPLRYERCVEFPANASKFEIRYVPARARYYSIATRILSEETRRSRNLLSLLSSEDLVTWRVERDIYDFRDSDPAKVGFQYVDFLPEGEELLFLCRTAIHDPINFHDANYSTFDRVSIAGER